MELYSHQEKALKKMHNGCILVGGVGSGKSITSLAYYFNKVCGGKDKRMDPKKKRDLYIITTARKRDSHEWEGDMAHFLLSPDPTASPHGVKVVIDSWNNIGKYENVADAFFIFDEQRVVGYGAWSKSFIKISKANQWILLSATPGDTWSDYIPVFIANGFYKNKTQFTREHIIFARFAKYPKIDRYINTDKLSRLRASILVPMKFERETIPHKTFITAGRNEAMYQDCVRGIWDPFKNEPCVNAASACYVLRKIVNTDPTRRTIIRKLMAEHKRAIIFYNFTYELEILRDIMNEAQIEYGEWNGEKHQPVPKTDRWAYLVQYTAGAEGWNCIDTDTIIFYSLNYSYKIMTQAAGRIDRLNTPFKDLFYYYIAAPGIDQNIRRALNNKKKFNEEDFFNEEFIPF